MFSLWSEIPCLHNVQICILFTSVLGTFQCIDFLALFSSTASSNALPTISSVQLPCGWYQYTAYPCWGKSWISMDYFTSSLFRVYYMIFGTKAKKFYLGIAIVNINWTAQCISARHRGWRYGGWRIQLGHLYPHGSFTGVESLQIMSGWKETAYSVVFKDVTLITELLETSESAGGTQCQFQLLGSYLKQNKQKQKQQQQKSLLWIQQMQWIPCFAKANVFSLRQGAFLLTQRWLQFNYLFKWIIQYFPLISLNVDVCKQFLKERRKSKTSKKHMQRWKSSRTDTLWMYRRSQPESNPSKEMYTRVQNVIWLIVDHIPSLGYLISLGYWAA